MAINFTRLFTAMGKLVGGLNEWNTGRGTTLDTRTATIRGQLTGIFGGLDSDLTTGATSAKSAGTTWAQYLQAKAAAVLIQEVVNDRPLVTQTVPACLTELVRQMGVSAQSLANAAGSVGSVTAVGGPTGTPTWVVSDTDPLTNAASNYTLPDSYVARCTAAGTFSFAGQASVALTDANWPQGSGVNTSLSVQTPATQSLGSDPGFETWDGTPNLTQWSYVAGAAQIARATDDPYGAGSVYVTEWTGNATTIRLRQQITSLSPNTTYLLHLFHKRTANPANTGALTIALRDASGTLLSGTTAASVNTSAGSATWTPLTVVVNTPTTLPSAVYLEIQYNGGVGDKFRVDSASILALPALYTGGLRVAVLRGVTTEVAGDQYTLAVTTTTPTTKLIRGMERLLSVSGYSDRIPTSGSPTQLDALIS